MSYHGEYNEFVISKWFKYKDVAITLRKKGLPIREVEKKLKIPRSTLSGWFKDIKLTKKQKEKNYKNWKKAIKNNRGKAILWHNLQKTNRIEKARLEANIVLNNIDIKNKHILELALSMLYLGEGSKDNRTSMGNSNPLILNFFIKSLERLYNIDKSNLKCDLHLRMDQNQDKLKKFWSKELGIPLSNFSFTKDKR